MYVYVSACVCGLCGWWTQTITSAIKLLLDGGSCNCYRWEVHWWRHQRCVSLVVSLALGNCPSAFVFEGIPTAIISVIIFVWKTGVNLVCKSITTVTPEMNTNNNTLRVSIISYVMLTGGRGKWFYMLVKNKKTKQYPNNNINSIEIQQNCHIIYCFCIPHPWTLACMLLHLDPTHLHMW